MHLSPRNHIHVTVSVSVFTRLLPGVWPKDWQSLLCEPIRDRRQRHEGNNQKTARLQSAIRRWPRVKNTEAANGKHNGSKPRLFWGSVLGNHVEGVVISMIGCKDMMGETYYAMK